jgi:lysophospholipase L1-like esterase
MLPQRSPICRPVVRRGNSGSVVFPASVVPAAWFNGNQQAFSDAAGSVPVSSGLIRRINEPAAQGSFWSSATDAERPNRESNSVRYDFFSSAGGMRMTRPDPGSVYRDACTIVVAYVARDESFAGPLMGVLQDSTQFAGFRNGSDQVYVNTTAGLFPTGLIVAPGQLNVMSVTYTPTSIEIKLDAAGVVTSTTTSVATAHTLLGSWNLGLDGSTYLYGSMSQGIVVPRAVSTSERDALMAWAKAQTVPLAYPLDRTLVAGVGDSITRGTGAVYGQVYLPLAIYNLRATKPLVEMSNCAIGGTGVTNILRAGSTLVRAQAFYNAGRVKNVMVVFLGTNDLANSNGVAYTLNGTGAPDGAGLYAACDAARAQGWKVIICTMLPRGDNPGFEATFNAQRATFNADVRANWSSHADALCDFALVSGMGADGDSNNATNYNSDKIHPTTVGQGLLEPTYRTALANFL